MLPDNSWMGLDPYGADLCPPTSGKDMIYRVVKDREGYCCRLDLLTPEETETARKASKPPAVPKRKKIRKAKNVL